MADMHNSLKPIIHVRLPKLEPLNWIAVILSFWITTSPKSSIFFKRELASFPVWNEKWCVFVKGVPTFWDYFVSCKQWSVTKECITYCYMHMYVVIHTRWKCLIKDIHYNRFANSHLSVVIKLRSVWWLEIASVNIDCMSHFVWHFKLRFCKNLLVNI